MKYKVIVRTTVNTWTTHSMYKKKKDAQDQADMVHGLVVPIKNLEKN